MGFGQVTPTPGRPSGAGVGTWEDPAKYNPTVTYDHLGNRQWQGGNTNMTATQGAVAYKNAMGLPSFQDLFDKLSGGAGGVGGGSTIGGLYDDKVFGNAGAAKAGAHKAAAELSKWKGDLAKGKASLLALKGQIADPTQTEGFKNIMKLTGERMGQATESARQQAANAQSRRGYVGGYNPAVNEQARLEAMGITGLEANMAERKSLQDQYAAEGDVYGTDVGGYKSALDAYGNLTAAYATTPTKSQSSNLQANPLLDFYSKLLGGAGGSFGDIFGTSSRNVMFDTTNQRNDAEANRQRNENILYRGRP